MQRHYFVNKGPLVFPVVVYGCESWTMKKAEHQRIDAFELWCWRRLLRVQGTARKSNQSILKKISPEYSLEGLMLKLKLQYFDHLIWRTDSLEKTWRWERLKTGGEGDDRGWEGWMASPILWTWVWVSSRTWWWAGKCAAVYGVAKIWPWLNDWTELNWTELESACKGPFSVCLKCEHEMTCITGKSSYQIWANGCNCFRFFCSSLHFLLI